MPAPRSTARVSLQRKLLVWLLLPQLVLWLFGGALAWRVALQNGEKGIDQTLTQSVKALARQIKPIGDGLLVDFPKAAQDILEQDPSDRVTYMVSSPPVRFLLGNAQLPPPPAGAGNNSETLLYHARLDDRPVGWLRWRWTTAPSTTNNACVCRWHKASRCANASPRSCWSRCCCPWA